MLGVCAFSITPECKLCQEIVGIIQNNTIIANETEQELLNFVLYMCDEIGGSIVEQECLVYVKPLNMLFQEILKDLNPPDVCYKLKFCSNTTI